MDSQNLLRKELHEWEQGLILNDNYYQLQADRHPPSPASPQRAFPAIGWIGHSV